MGDVHEPKVRSLNMSRILGRNTKTELLLAKALWHRGHRYRKNNKTVYGKPDITFKSIKLAIFVDSEFFHGKDWETKKKPVTNAEFWDKKIRRNIERDKEVNERLESEGWTVLRFWSNDIKKNLKDIVDTIERVIAMKRSRVVKIYSQENIHTLAAEPSQKSAANAIRVFSS